MAGTQPPEAPEQAPESGEGGDSRLDKLEDKVDSIIDQLKHLLKGDDGEPEQPEAPADPASQTMAQRAGAMRTEMQEAIEEHDRQRDKDKAFQDLSETVGKLKPILEKPPRVFRKIEERMGWVEKEDQ